MEPILVVLAAGMARRFGRLKQLDPVGPGGECLLDYGIFDALRAGFGRVVLVVRAGLEPEFRSNLERFFPGLDAHLVVQRIDAHIPAGRRRGRPWGTGHAVLEAAAEIDGPFAIMNADDFYGRRSFRILAERLRRFETAAAEGMIVGYPLDRTVSEHGGVSRAVCEQNDDGTLRRIVEHTDVRRTADGGIVGTTAGHVQSLQPGTLVSMNLWGLTPAAFPFLAGGFERFVAGWSGDDDAEFVLPEAIGAAVRTGQMRIDVVESPDEWFGMTFAGDRQAVCGRLRALVADGEYPEDLAMSRG